MSTLLVEVIAEMPSEDAKKQMCSETVAKVESRAFDLENTDPELTKYLRSIAGTYHVDVSIPAVPPASEAPNARRDAAALLGTWRSEKVVARGWPTALSAKAPAAAPSSFRRSVS